MNMKQVVKEKLPVSVLESIQRHKSFRVLKKLRRVEIKRFSAFYSAGVAGDIPQVESRLIFFVHQIEKGFSFDIYQYGRGKEALRNIASLSSRLVDLDANWRCNPIYKDMILALGEYRRRHCAADYDISFMTELFDEAMNEDIIAASKQGYPSIEILRGDKADNDSISFRELTECRHAVRTYSDEPVTHSELEKAVAMSLRTPSVCNRQPSRVRIYTDKELIARALKIQGGFGGYSTPPALMLISSDLRAFLSVNECNEAYVDGGLFSMSLLYSLEACGLAACPLNTMFGSEADEATRELLGIPDNEVFIMYIAVGHFRDVSKICRSDRFGLDRILLN